MFGTFEGSGSAPFKGFPAGSFKHFMSEHPTYGPAIGDSLVEQAIGNRGYDGGMHNSPFNTHDGQIKAPFTAPGPYNPFMFMAPRRRRLNLLSVVQCIVLPILIFGAISWLFAFSVHEWMPIWCWFAVAFCILLAGVFLAKAFLVLRKHQQEERSVPWYLRQDDPTWYLFLAIAVAASCLLGLALGLYIYGSYSDKFYKLSRLHTHKNVDPVWEGKAYLDTGAIYFKKDSYVSTAQSIGYKDGHIYCVAPIKFGNDLVKNFDFWAVGVDCCDGFPGNFNCFDHRADSFAHGALRVIDDGAIPFYRLATQQMGVEFLRSSHNPLFFEWMRDPEAKIQSYFRDARTAYIWGFVIFAVLEIVAVIFLANFYWKDRNWG